MSGWDEATMRPSPTCGAGVSILLSTWGDNPVSSRRSHSRAKGPGTSAGAFPVERSLSGEGPRGPRRGAKGSGGTPGTPWFSSPVWAPPSRRQRAAAPAAHPRAKEPARLSQRGCNCFVFNMTCFSWSRFSCESKFCINVSAQCEHCCLPAKIL
jgi:hypothetical protein